MGSDSEQPRRNFLKFLSGILVLTIPFGKANASTGPLDSRAMMKHGRKFIMTERDKAIDDLLAKQEITEVIFKYCRCMDRCDHSLADEVFWPESKVDYGEQMYVGTGHGFVDMSLSAHNAMFLSHSHQHGNILIKVDGDRAYSELYGDVTLRRKDEDGQLIDSRNLGRYLDLWEKREGIWKILERVFLLDIEETGPAAGNLFQQTGKRDKADPSYRLFTEGKLLPLQ